ncbi:hypothetical protein MAP00_008204 [Monascus purpureus]|nr:hypothetical protein MAP00_008204 [Monascus purpureus]
MSGLNPFRLRRSEDISGRTAALPTSSSVSSPAPSPLPNRPIVPTPAVEAPRAPLPSKYNGDTPVVPDAESYFSYKSDTQGRSWSSPRVSSENDRLAPTGTAPHPLPSSSSASSPMTLTPPSPIAGRREQDIGVDFTPSSGADTPQALPNFYPGQRSAGSSRTDLSRRSLSSGRPRLTEPPNRPDLDVPAQSEVNGESRSLAGRSKSKEKKPPPPPKSHHGKPIEPTPAVVPTTEPSKPVDLPLSNDSTLRSSPHTTPPSLNKASQLASDYFFSVSAQPTESLKRSQSQLKRPPTPPLSRRHSQMRRSNTTTSRNNLARVSMPPGGLSFDASNLPSPGRRSLNLPRQPEEEGDDRGRFNLQPQEESITRTKEAPAPPIARMSSTRSAKRGSLTVSAVPPPPPPPRRVRGTSNSDNNTNSNVPQEDEMVGYDKNTLPQPSNASDILADLSRLQKEVDDLRGQYEHRKGSH